MEVRTKRGNKSIAYRIDRFASRREQNTEENTEIVSASYLL
jgi:hypothetical protein